ncbi:MAG TPA: tRNA (adenosine(37)-N6)-threonylcarbamoyltransferase complex dimerization subunit type 1 TsaB [Acidobacteriota bacterium]|nr:tRNA (adenosine(37)-N6)-threonylcarbamoyltransferase complex dimerization subunit type 1 TsaB [Acidobacteriota bacterium]
MYILAIDTATNSGGVALSRNSEIIGEIMLKTPLEYSDRLLGIIEFLLRQLKINIDDIACFSVAVGPGSFTGLRIGIAAVKGFCHALERPVVDVSTLQALAWTYRWAGEPVAPMIDARRQQIYGAVYAHPQPQESHLVMPEVVLPPAEWLSTLPADSYIFVGDGAQMYSRTVLAHHPNSRLLRTDNRILSALCEIAYWRMTRGEVLPASRLKAHYIRPSDAEL